ncbi:MAG: amidohydrolase family protein, partial [Anaerolineales bacterium]|nr:amidohydrolase family protein [Anaerolineales bacterium]
DRIEFVGHGYPHPVDQIVDAGRAIISPGFIDLDALADIDHAILDTWVSAEIGLGLQWSADYFRERRHDLFSREEEAFKHRYALSQLALNGVTTFMPIAGEQYKRWCETYEEFGDVVTIVEELGLRAYLGPSYRSGVNVVHEDGRRDVLFDEAEGERGLQEAIRFVETFDGAADGRVTGCLLPARIETVTPDLLRQTRAAAERLGCLIRLHCLQSETEARLLQQFYGKSAIQLLQELDLLNPQVLIPHAIYLQQERPDPQTPSELETFAASGAPVIHCPLVFARAGQALHSFRRYQELGITLALGSDTFPPDMIRVMETGLLAGNLAEGRQDAHQAAAMFRAATLGGSRALGREDLGRLAAGAKADIVIIDLSDYRLGPIEDPIRTLVLMGNGRNIRDVIVDGRTIVKDGQIPGLDVADMQRQARDYFARMRAAYPERDFKRRSVDTLFPPSFRSISKPANP